MKAMRLTPRNCARPSVTSLEINPALARLSFSSPLPTSTLSLSLLPNSLEPLNPGCQVPRRDGLRVSSAAPARRANPRVAPLPPGQGRR